MFKAFNRWGEFFRGEAHFVVVENEALCHEPCAVSLYRKDLVREITFPTPKQVIEFIRSNKANFLTELTEKKGAHLEAHYDYMCILLIDVENQTEWIRAERAIWHTRELLIEQHNIHIGYVWGPHKFLVGYKQCSIIILSLLKSGALRWNNLACKKQTELPLRFIGLRTGCTPY